MRSWALLAITILLVAGCLGGAKPKASPAPTTTDPNALPDGVDNVLEGAVYDNGQNPLPNATVKVVGTDFNATTTADGKYRFENLAPKDYLVTVAKEGYITKTQRAIIEDHKIFELNFVLLEKPNLAPYHDVNRFNGQISCHIAYSTTTEKMQHADCFNQAPASDPNNIV